MEVRKNSLPNDKQQLMDRGGYEVHNRDVTRKVFPRIYREYKELYAGKKMPQCRDLSVLYFYLLDYVDGREFHADGLTPNDRFGASYPSKQQITEDTGITEKRIKPLTEVLRTNGLITDIQDVWEGTNRYKRYYLSFCPQVSEDGFLVNADGEKIMPDTKLYK